jgi:hypothetical protein
MCEKIALEQRIFLAITNGCHDQIAELILDEDFDVNSKGLGERIFLMVVIMTGNLEVARIIF